MTSDPSPQGFERDVTVNREKGGGRQELSPAAVLVARLAVRASIADAAAGPTIVLRNEGPHVAVVTAATISPVAENDEPGRPLTPDGGFPVTLRAGGHQTFHSQVSVDGAATVEVVCHDGRGKQLDLFEIDVRFAA